MPKQKPGRSVQTYATPAEFLIAVKRKLGIDAFVWDLAADRTNACALKFWTPEDNSLLSPWAIADPGEWCWLNPPYDDIGPWVQRAVEQQARVAVLVPASVGANWWRDWVQDKARVLLLNGRITFVGETDPYPKDCVLLLYGPEQVPGSEVWSWMNDLTPEERDMAKARTGKTPKVRAIKDGGTKRGRAKKSKESGGREDQGESRVTTFKPNGGGSMAAAPAPASESSRLGPILLPEPDDAVKVLAELAQLNDRALAAKERYEELKEATKGAREKYDELMEMVSTRLRVTTHQSDLPLFPATREADQQKMEAASAAGGVLAIENTSDDPSIIRTDLTADQMSGDVVTVGPVSASESDSEDETTETSAAQEIASQALPGDLDSAF